MTPTDSASPRAGIVSAAFYVTLILGLLSLLVSPWSPAALLQAPLFLIASVGLWKRRAWSAYGLALLSLVSTVVPIVARSGGPLPASTLIVAGVFTLAIAMLLFFAGRALERLHGRRGLAWPWIACSVFVAGFFTLFGIYQMPTGSMEKTLLIGDHIAVLKTHGRPPTRGELVVHYYPVNRKDVFVKRVVGVPGDRVRIRNKQLFINGTEATEPYAEHLTEYVDSYRDNFPSNPTVPLYPQAMEMLNKNVADGEVVVPAGRYFVLGDNRDSSLDSRYWGFIEDSDIIGTPKMIYYSVKPILTQPGENRLPILNVRWGRMFRKVG
jgi:signal peptidase I